MHFVKFVRPLIGRAVHYKRDGSKVLQEQVRFTSIQSGFIFRPAHDSSVHLTRQTNVTTSLYFQNIYDAVWQDIEIDIKQNVHWVDYPEGTTSSFVGFLQIFFWLDCYVINTHRPRALLCTCSPSQLPCDIQVMDYRKRAHFNKTSTKTSWSYRWRWCGVIIGKELCSLLANKVAQRSFRGSFYIFEAPQPKALENVLDTLRNSYLALISLCQ